MSSELAFLISHKQNLHVVSAIHLVLHLTPPSIPSFSSTYFQPKHNRPGRTRTCNLVIFHTRLNPAFRTCVPDGYDLLTLPPSASAQRLSPCYYDLVKNSAPGSSSVNRQGRAFHFFSHTSNMYHSFLILVMESSSQTEGPSTV